MVVISLIGAGRIGQVHALNLAQNPNVRLKYIADVNQDAAEQLALKTGAKASSAFEAISDPEVDAVVIASSTHTHAEYLIQAAENKKAILCEKPIDLSLSKVRDCVEAVEKNGVLCALGFNRRFDPHF